MNRQKFKRQLYQRLLPHSLRVRNGITFIRTMQQAIDIYGAADCNELWVDFTVRPTNPAEFNYIPLRVSPTGVARVSDTDFPTVNKP